MKTPEKNEKRRPVGLSKEVPPIGFFCDVSMAIEGLRVATKVRIEHLKKRGQKDEDTEQVFRQVSEIEKRGGTGIQ